MSMTRLGGSSSQETFDALMRSISEPGTIRSLPEAFPLADVPAVAWLALALADVEVTVGANLAALDSSTPPITELVADATGATITELPKAWIALLDQPTPTDVALLERGSALEPELGARVAIAVDGLSPIRKKGWSTLSLTGPGIPGSRTFAVAGVDPKVLAGLGRASGDFPAGVDTWLFAPDGHVAAIPRSTHVAIEHEEN